ncbi:hypothetical protein BDQ12DRAFT_718283 [Crucibulum laeve]|uniref:CCHC-type domain-containing protein n=1 Tax=Crucibulum laeve TaxID=68775 RepID=A0A5C3MPB6_9AGAR|nr:hypothetical protein BDQ12DRAFT_718283 [Crucibulum laeve]
MAVAPGKKDRKFKPKGACFNCGKKGHYKNKCPKLADKDKEKAGSLKKGDTANVVESDSDSDVAFVVNGFKMDSDADMLEYELMVDSSSQDALDHASNVDDWFSEIGDNAYMNSDSSWDTKELPGASGDESNSFISWDTDSDAAEELITNVVAEGLSRDAPHIEEIPPKSLCAANKQNFSAVGVGKMIVNISNGVDILKLQLMEVLYSSEVGYTLVSIGRLDKKGFSATFADGKCIIRNPKG